MVTQRQPSPEPPFVETVIKEISDIVTTLDDSQAVLDAVVRLVTRMLSVDRCSLMLLEPDGRKLRIRAGYGIPSEAIRSYHARLGEGIAGWVALQGKPMLIDDIEQHPRFARKSAPGYTTTSLLSVPLLLRGRAIGVLNVNNKRDGGRFSRSDELLLSTVANFVVIALEKAKSREAQAEKQRIDADLGLAQDIQHVFLPRTFPADRGLQFAAQCASAYEVAGDFYDVIPMSNGATCALVGDVCGKGIAAALYMARVMSYFRAVIGLSASTENLIGSVNRFLADEWIDLTFVTAGLAVFAEGHQRASLYSAGHMAPYLFRETSGELRAVDVESGPPLGVDAEAVFAKADLELHGGDVLVMYTDGITEAVNPEGEFFGRARLEQTLRAHSGTPEQLVESISKAVLKFSAGLPQKDDQTLLVVRKT